MGEQSFILEDGQSKDISMSTDIKNEQIVQAVFFSSNNNDSTIIEFD